MSVAAALESDLKPFHKLRRFELRAPVSSLFTYILHLLITSATVRRPRHRLNPLPHLLDSTRPICCTSRRLMPTSMPRDLS
jgi:hypothetical protein